MNLLPGLAAAPGAGMAMRRKGDRGGFVLLVVMLYLQVMVLLGAVVVTVAGGDLRKVMRDMCRQKMIIAAQATLVRMESVAAGNCEILSLSSVALRAKQLSWWRQNGCHANNEIDEYFFIRERLLKGEIRTIKNQLNQSLKEDIYRNTLLYVSDVNKYNSILLQSTTLHSATGFVRRLGVRRLW